MGRPRAAGPWVWLRALAAAAALGPSAVLAVGADGQPLAQPEPPRAVVAALVRSAAIPVYAPAGNAHGLRLVTLATAGDAGGGPAGVQLLFADFQPEGSRVALSVRSLPLQVIVPPVVDAQAVLTGYNPFHDLYIDLQLDSRGAARAYPTGLPESFVATAMVDGASRDITLVCWPVDNGFCVYWLSADRTTIVGGALGLDADALLALLGQLVRLNDDPDLVARLEREYQDHGQAVALLGGARADRDPSLRHRLPLPPRTRQSGGISVAAFDGEQQTDRQYYYDIVNLSATFALLIENTFPFDGGFAIVLPPEFRPRITFAAGVNCAVGEAAHILICHMDQEFVQLVFITEEEP